MKKNNFLLFLSNFISGIDLHEKILNFPERISLILKEERNDTKEFMFLSQLVKIIQNTKGILIKSRALCVKEK